MVTVACFGSQRTYFIDAFKAMSATANIDCEFRFIPHNLTLSTAPLAKDCEIVSIFVNDECGSSVIPILYENGCRCICTRSAGFNMIDLDFAKEHNIPILRVPAYSPYAVAEMACTLFMALNRNLIPHQKRVLNADFSLDGLVGFDVRGCTVGVCGTGLIGRCFVNIMKGFGANILAYDPFPFKPWTEDSENCPVTYVELDELLSKSDIISIHVPLMPQTKHFVNDDFINKMKKGAILINVSRGDLVDTNALIRGLDSGKVGAAGLDVVEGENDLFFEKREMIKLEHVNNLLKRDNVIVTGHLAFLTKEALNNIMSTTLDNIKCYLNGEECANQVKI